MIVQMAKAAAKKAVKAAPKAPAKATAKAPPKDNQDPNSAGDAMPPKPKAGFLFPIIFAILGIAMGAGAAVGYFVFIKPPAAAVAAAPKKTDEKAEDKETPPNFIKLDHLTVPMTTADGKLVGYFNMELLLQAKQSDLEYIKLRLPLLKHSINEALNTHSVVSDADPYKVDYDRTATLLLPTINTALGKPLIEKALVISAVYIP